MVLERDFRATLKKDLESVGCCVFTIHGHVFQAAGWPDIQVYHPCWTGHLELKVGGNTATKLQKWRMLELRKRGTPAYLLDLTGEDLVVLNSEEVGIMRLAGWRNDTDHKRRTKLLLIALRFASGVVMSLKDFDIYQWGERNGISSQQIADVVEFLRNPEV